MTDRQLSLYNALGRNKQVFTPLNKDCVGVYVCGPTVYNYAHIGNARPAVVFDLLVRVLRVLYPRVLHVSNITDIDDKIIDAAAQTGEPIATITRKYTDIYNQDMAKLGVAAPDVQPLATEHVPEMIAMIGDLLKNGHAYEAEGHVLFSVPSFPAYGRLSGRNRDEQIAGARVDVAPYKKDPADFVLWKPSDKEGQPGWNSPWGYGRPGWHIECSAMSEKYLGKVFDIHGGGVDLTFPHHENEQAQSCCANQSEDFAKFWVHNGFVTVEGEKMSKSIGNVLLVHDLAKNAMGEVLRLNLLSAHYRQPLDWTAKGVNAAEAVLSKFYKQLEEIEDYAAIAVDLAGLRADAGVQGVMEALCDDLNTPRAIAELHSLFKDFAAAQGAQKHAMAKQIKALGAILGVLQHDPKEWAQKVGAAQAAQIAALDEDWINTMIARRVDARAAKDFALADSIRKELAAQGVELHDGPDGTHWSLLARNSA